MDDADVDEQRSFPVSLCRAIATYLADWQEVLEGDLVHDLCMTYSEQFIPYLHAEGLEGEVVSGFKMDALDGFMVVEAGHMAVLLPARGGKGADIVVDWTVRQFDPDCPVPRVATLGDWRKDWQTIGEAAREAV